ncbi:hypothetical protein Bca101_047591 [Brassica carinata]
MLRGFFGWARWQRLSIWCQIWSLEVDIHPSPGSSVPSSRRFSGACLKVRQSSSRLASSVAQVQIWEALLWVLRCGRVRGGLLSVLSTTTLVLGGVMR